MKRISILLIKLLTTASLVSAQQYTTSFASNDTGNKIEIMIDYGQIEITGHASNEVIVEASGYQPPPEKAEGLKPLYAKGQDNSGIGLSVKKEGTLIRLMSIRAGNETDYFIKVPDNTALMVNVGPRNEALMISNIKGELEIKAHSDNVVLHQVNGPIVANGISSDVEIVLGEMNTQKPSMVSLVSGDIDVSMPGNTAADLKLSSVSGEIYTDFDVDLQHEEAGDMGYRKPILGTINGGGSPLELRTVSGNIFLRKK
jgi:hypothetical protein